MWNQRKSELSREDILPGWSERAARRGLPLVRLVDIEMPIFRRTLVYRLFV